MSDLAKQRAELRVVDTTDFTTAQKQLKGSEPFLQIKHRVVQTPTPLAVIIQTQMARRLILRKQTALRLNLGNMETVSRSPVKMLQMLMKTL